jgi:ferrous iron transport protein B
MMLMKVAEQQENSYIGQLGRGIEPVIKPLDLIGN